MNLDERMLMQMQDIEKRVRYLETLETGLTLDAWPVGSIYTSVDGVSPAQLFGGTWVAFGAGKVMVGIDAGDASFDVAEETGGAKTHTLGTTEIPAHSHTIDINYGVAAGSDYSGGWGSASAGQATGSTGGGLAHNNLQPYIVVYFWKRTA